MVVNAIKQREYVNPIPNEIKVEPFFRDIFVDKYYLIGKKGRTIKCLREKHKPHPRKYRGRKKYSIK